MVKESKKNLMIFEGEKELTDNSMVGLMNMDQTSLISERIHLPEIHTGQHKKNKVSLTIEDKKGLESTPNETISYNLMLEQFKKSTTIKTG